MRVFVISIQKVIYYERHKMKIKQLLACSLIISTAMMTGCSSESISLSSGEASTEVEKNDESTKDASEDIEAKDKASESEEASTTDEATEDDEKVEATDTESLLQQFLDDEIEATSIYEDGTERTFKYSDLPHDEDDWECFSYDDDCFVDLDNDDENELILNGPYGGMYLDARDGKVYVLAEGEGTAGTLSYVEYENLIYIVHADTSHGGRQMYLFDRYEDGEVVESFSLSAEYWDNDFDYYDQDSDFTFKDEKITMEEYETLCKELFGHKTKTEWMRDSAIYEGENFDYSQEKIINDGSDKFYEKLEGCFDSYYYPEDNNGNSGTLSIFLNDSYEYTLRDLYKNGDYRFISSESDIEYFIGCSICLKYPETVSENGDATFTYYVITCYDYYVHVYKADENYENLEYLYTGWVKY